MIAATAAAGCGEPTPPLRLDAYTFKFDDFGDSLVFHWPAERMPIRYWADPGDSLNGYITYALQQWEAQFLYGEFRSVMVTDSSRADVIMRATVPVPTGSLAHLPERGLDPGCAGITVPDSSSDDARQLIGPMRITITWTFLDTKTRADSDARVRCLARVVTHEVGHSLGIFNFNHAGTDSTDIMYVFPRVAVPSERDRSTVQRLYHTPADILAPVRPQ